MKCFYTPLLIVPLFLTSPSYALIISTNYKITFSVISGEGGYVDLENVITALQLLIVLMPDQVLKEADIDGDGKIGLIEAVTIMNQLSN